MFQYNFMQNAFMIAILISILCPLIGMFLVLKRYSMMGDTLSHASFAGVAAGLMVHIHPILSAFCLTSIFGVLIEILRRHFKNYAELILVVILSLSVGIAITLISSGLVHANIDSFLFGSILTVTREDFYIVLLLSILSLIIISRLYHSLMFMIFDEEGAKISGINIKFINYTFAVLVAATISVSIRIVGILVISSLIALPIATALQLRKGFKTTLLFGILFSFIDIISGITISYWIDAAPGGVIAIMSVFVLAFVLFFQNHHFPFNIHLLNFKNMAKINNMTANEKRDSDGRRKFRIQSIFKPAWHQKYQTTKFTFETSQSEQRTINSGYSISKSAPRR
ncbi:zinc transport system permease protein [Propionispira arboris]|uniref:Zinc transport system permease protein n=1 Tax=Propionispira arboris TaxID=84035 RepID=A0A1H6UQW8_9FIRM|nr:metal ABC transporter permease [Propionispira arboris]SEI94086.1 zinc transport system permease protein [Propionispira arboris]